MRYSSPTALAIVVIACLGTACTSKTAATKGNFKNAIQAELDKDPACISADVPKDVPSFNGRLRPDEQLEPLVKVGLVTRSQAMVQQSVMDVMFGEKRKKVPGLHYELSSLGKQYVKPVKRPMMGFGGPSANVCYGNRKVDEVVRYTEPASAMGMTVTQVTYTWKLTNVADWAKNPDVEKTYYTPRDLQAADTPEQANMDLALSNDGWHAPNLGF